MSFILIATGLKGTSEWTAQTKSFVRAQMKMLNITDGAIDATFVIMNEIYA
jgi:hypothetical protein